jgi:uncharacterized membrane protein
MILRQKTMRLFFLYYSLPRTPFGRSWIRFLFVCMCEWVGLLCTMAALPPLDTSLSLQRRVSAGDAPTPAKGKDTQSNHLLQQQEKIDEEQQKGRRAEDGSFNSERLRTTDYPSPTRRPTRCSF